MRCIVAVSNGGRYQYYVRDGIYSYDMRDAHVFPNSQWANSVANSIGGIIIPLE